MFTFLRKLRRSLIETGSARKPVLSAVERYLLYAIGEIALVVIGILIALQINNWNGDRKARNQFKQSILGLAEDIRKDTSIIQNFISSLERQEQSAKVLIPILESKEKKIVDTLEFNYAFQYMSRSILMDFNTEIWDEIRRSGLHKTHADARLDDVIHTYYHRYTRSAKNWQSAKTVRMEMRWLKYELLSQTDIDQWNSDHPKPFSKRAYETIFNEKRVVDLTKAIYYTSSLFKDHFETSKRQAIDVLKLIEEIYGDRKDDTE